MRVLAVGAHPDDIEILCAGTLARFIQRGDHVSIAHLCNGDCGHYELPAETIKAIRKEESKKAAAVLGAELIPFDDVGDGDLIADDLNLRQKVVSLIKKAQPDLIITHSPNDYMADHVAVSRLVFDASFMATLPNWQEGSTDEVLKKVPPIYYMDTLAGVGFQPEEYVDITDTFEVKKAMLECHQSQLTWLDEHDDVDIVEVMTVHSRFRGIQCGVKYAEAFRPLRVWTRQRPQRLLP